MKKHALLTKLRGGASIFVLAAATTVALPAAFPDFTGSVAFADEGGGGGNGAGGEGNGSGGEGNGSGGENGHSDGDEGGHSDGGEGGKKGGHDQEDSAEADDEDSDGRGPNYGQPDGEDTGGKPEWAQEGIPEVELGRLNVARSPEHVLNQALAEALATFSPAMLDFYNLSLADAVEALKTEWDDLTFFDSPLQNLALLDEALGGTNSLASVGVTNDVDTLAAMFLGLASDKVVEVSDDTVLALSIILGHELTEAEIEELSDAAESIRAAALEGHG